MSRQTNLTSVTVTLRTFTVLYATLQGIHKCNTWLNVEGTSILYFLVRVVFDVLTCSVKCVKVKT